MSVVGDFFEERTLIAIFPLSACVMCLETETGYLSEIFGENISGYKALKLINTEITNPQNGLNKKIYYEKIESINELIIDANFKYHLTAPLYLAVDKNGLKYDIFYSDIFRPEKAKLFLKNYILKL